MAMCHHSRTAVPSTTGSATDPDLERRVVEEGKRLLAAVRGPLIDGSRLLERVMEDEGFRVQALRFVDVLPAQRGPREHIGHMPYRTERRDGTRFGWGNGLGVDPL
jgi:hypothetical protein